MRAIAYTRVSTAEQADSGLGLEAQASCISSEVMRRGWFLAGTFTDAGASGKSLTGRPQLAEALELLDAGKADVLVVSKLDRLSRSLVDFAGLLERANRKGWAVTMVDMDVDTSTPNGELMASIVAAMAQWERKLIGQRTKDALAVKKSQGVQLGRPRTVTEETRARITGLRFLGLTYQQIADYLDGAGIPCGQGGTHWYANTVRRIVLAEEQAA